DVAVVIDVLRATSTMTAALHFGAKKIVPVLSVEEAKKYREDNFEVLTVGERGSKKIDGFDLGNSPRELSEEMIEGKELVITTTNGTVAVSKSKRARKVILASFLNLGSVVRLLKRESGRIELQCAGTDGDPSLEDTLLAGALVSQLKIGHINDSCRISSVLYEAVKDNLESFILENGVHAKRLVSLGFFEDVGFCAKINLYDLVPLWRDGGFVRG
ncbi:2-phosphosulfolactate phosphatase, partial [Mesotoga sp.]|uniref:2-phosphosulfolactate phosphatase n=2 Tax=Mesotoga sp. TaxID=2053577 RepID=UPI003562C675